MGQRIERAGRFIGDQQRRPVLNRDRNQDALRLTDAKLAGIPVEQTVLLIQVDHAEQLWDVEAPVS